MAAVAAAAAAAAAAAVDARAAVAAVGARVQLLPAGDASPGLLGPRAWWWWLEGVEPPVTGLYGLGATYWVEGTETRCRAGFDTGGPWMSH